jgi:hypothetical protein
MSLNKNEDCIQSLEFIINSQTQIQDLLMIGGDFILNETMFNGDLNELWTTIHHVKSLSFHFMKIVWQYKTDTTCLQPVMEMLVHQLSKDKSRFETLIQNADICKIIKKGLATLSHFAQIEKNTEAAAFFT